MCLRGEQGAKIDKYMDISVLFFLAVLIFRLYSRKLAKNTGLRCNKKTVVQYCDISSAYILKAKKFAEPPFQSKKSCGKSA